MMDDRSKATDQENKFNERIIHAYHSLVHSFGDAEKNSLNDGIIMRHKFFPIADSGLASLSYLMIGLELLKPPVTLKPLM
jgi:hypothetical protein